MTFKFKANRAEEAERAVDHFFRFHDDYVAEIEVKFEDYKAINDKGESKGIKDARITIILTVNSRPYGKEHNRTVREEFKNVKSFNISSTQEPGPKWGIFTTEIGSDGADIIWDFHTIRTGAEFVVVCSEIILTSDFIRQDLQP